MDYMYTLAKMRQQDRINEANAWRLVKAAKAAKAGPVPGPVGARNRLLVWLGNLLVTRASLPMQSK